MNIFPTYSFEIQSMHRLSDAERILWKMIKANSLCIIENSAAKPRQILFTAKSNNLLFRNAFSPVVVVALHPDTFETKIVANFALRNSIKVILCIYIAIALFLEISLLALFFMQDLTTPFLLLLPLLLMLFSVIISHLGLKFSIIPLKKLIVSAFETQDR